MLRLGMFLSLLLALLLLQESHAQSYAFGVKGGLTVGLQQGNGLARDALFAYHGIGYIETAPEENNSALYAQLGYHVKGSALRNTFGRSFFDGQIYRVRDREFQYRNISLALGAKQKKDFGINAKLYYHFGVRVDYTLNTNLFIYEDYNLRYNTLFFPIDPFVQKWNYGFSAGGGFEFPFTDLIGGIVEVTVSPDVSRQYLQPQVNNVTNPFTGQSTSFGERQARNLVVELTVGLRFLRKVIYID